MAESRHQRHYDDERDDGIYVPPPREQTPPPSPWAPPRQIQPHQAADNAVPPAHAAPAAPPPDSAAPPVPPSAAASPVPPPAASPVAWQQDATWQPEQVLTGEVEQGPAVQETDIYGNPVPGHYRSGVRYADADAEIDNDHFSAGRTVWSQPSPQAWTPEEPHRPARPPDSSETQALAPIPPSPPMRPGPPAAPAPTIPPPSSPPRGMFEPANPAPSPPPRGMFEPAGPAPSPPPRGMFEPASPPRPGGLALPGGMGLAGGMAPPGGLALPAQRPPSELTGPLPPSELTGPGDLTGPPPPGGYAPGTQPPRPAGTSQPTSSGELIPRSAGFAASAPPIQPTAPPGDFAPPAPPAPPVTPPSGFDPASTSGQPPIQPTLSQQFSRRSSPAAPARPYFPPPEALASAPASAPPKAAPPPLTRAGSGGRQRWWIALGAAVLALAIAAGALIGLNLASHSGDKNPGSLAAGTSCGGRPVLSVAVAPEFAPIVEKAAAAIPGAADGCSMVKVAALEPAATLSTLANNPPDAWIPPSTAWLRMSGPRTASAPGSGGPTAVPKPSASSSPNNGLFVPDATSLARSPIVVAAPKPFADGIGWPDKQLGWTQLTAGVISHQIPKFSMGNPLKDTASLLAVLGVQVAMAGTTKDPGIAQMRALTLRARLADADADPTDLLKKAAGLSDPAKAVQELGLFPVSEQELWQYNRESHLVQLAGIYPTDTLMEADYPLALTTKTADDQARRDIATKLADLITARTFIGSLTERGFRPAAKTASTAGAGIALAPNASGLLAQYPRPIPLPPQVAEPAAIWAQYKQLTFQTLLLVDGSGSMNDPVRLRDGTQSTKADLLRQAGAQASQLFGEETSLGMWLFASPNATAPPFLVALPFGPINEKINGVPRRDVMRTVAAGYKAYPSAGTPLFETVLRGIDDMRKRQKANTITMVVVLTDGRDEDSPFSMTQQQFLAKLSALRDPAHPLPVFAIGYGADADMDVLNQMAKLTGGQAAASNDPSDLASAMAKIFLAAHLR